MSSSSRTPRRASRAQPKTWAKGAGFRERGSRTKGKPNVSPKSKSVGSEVKRSAVFGNERFGLHKGAVKDSGKYQIHTGLNNLAGSQVPAADTVGTQVRLHKLMANSGVASRRMCEQMIADGRVEVNGRTVTRMGMKVDPQRDRVAVDGMTVPVKAHIVYAAFNKPRGVVSTMDDPEGRPCISDYLGKYRDQRLFHVGRLDSETEGLLLLTNDGELAHRLTHPKYEVPKTYLVQVPGPMEKGIGRQLMEGVTLEDGFVHVDGFRLIGSAPGKVLAEVVLHSGKNRIVRRMFKEIGYPVDRLVRVKFGPIDLGDHKPGSVRGLGNQEIGHLLAEVGL